MLSVLRLPQPVIARVEGLATAAGCQLVATCDLAIASESSQFATSGINVGLFCSTPGVAVGRALARKHAMDLLLTGDFISAARAAEIGLINKAVPDANLDAEVDALARKLANKSAHALALGKTAFYRQLEMGISDAYAFAGAEMARNMMDRDAAEGIDAFMENAHRPGTRAPATRTTDQGSRRMSEFSYSDELLTKLFDEVKTIALVGASPRGETGPAGA